MVAPEGAFLLGKPSSRYKTMHRNKIFAFIFLVVVAYATPVFTITAMADGTTTDATLLPQEAPAPVAVAPLRLRITAYSSSVDETDSTPFLTANGTSVRDGIVATNLLPLGTKITIPALFGDKVFTVEDRMNRRFQKSIDIWMTTKAKAIYFGLHYADVVVLEKSPINLTLIK